MSDPTRDHRFARSWRRDYGRPQRSARERIMPAWLWLVIIAAVLLFLLALFFPALLPW